jgi:hypothetical protein
MMRKKEYYINIVKPCRQEWNSLEKRNTNSFCSKCSKEVIDLTKNSDSKIIHLLDNQPSKICGRLKPAPKDLQTFSLFIPNDSLLH